MAVNRAKAQSAEPRTSIVGRPVGQSPIARRTFGKDVPALDLGGISLLVINDNEFVRTYMERLFSIMRVGSVADGRGANAVTRKKRPRSRESRVVARSARV